MDLSDGLPLKNIVVKHSAKIFWMPDDNTFEPTPPPSVNLDRVTDFPA